jgi:hypothetical protein
MIWWVVGQTLSSAEVVAGSRKVEREVAVRRSSIVMV